MNFELSDLLIVLGIGGLFFVLGWLFPIEGPYDYVYDNYAKTPAVKRPHKGLPAPAPKTNFIHEDYNEDGIPEWYEIIPLFDVNE